MTSEDNKKLLRYKQLYGTVLGKLMYEREQEQEQQLEEEDEKAIEETQVLGFNDAINQLFEEVAKVRDALNLVYNNNFYQLEDFMEWFEEIKQKVHEVNKVQWRENAIFNEFTKLREDYAILENQIIFKEEIFWKHMKELHGEVNELHGEMLQLYDILEKLLKSQAKKTPKPKNSKKQ